MIVRKPYAFLIKNFRIIHGILFLFVLYLAKQTLDIYDFAINNSLRSSIFHGTYYGQQCTWRNFYNTFLGHHFYFCEDNHAKGF